MPFEGVAETVIDPDMAQRIDPDTLYLQPGLPRIERGFFIVAEPFVAPAC